MKRKTRHYNPARGNDASAVRAVIERYFYGLDSRRRDLVESCFTEEACARYQNGTSEAFEINGNRAIADYFHSVIAQFTATSHALSNAGIVMSGRTAESDTFVVAHVVVNGRVLVRGLRYDDTWVRTSKEWRIRKRMHTPLWQYEAPQLQPDVPMVAR